MRHQLHFGLFALALASVAQANAQDGPRREQRPAVEIAAYRGPQRTQRVHPSVTYGSRSAYLDSQRDLAEIVSIAQRWERATARNDWRAQALVDRELDAWLVREIREPDRQPYDQVHERRICALRDELALLERQAHRRHGHRGYRARKTQIFHELIGLSERQAAAAYAGVHPSIRISLARR
ncbi:MAG: hypothetical protein WCE62_00910 [Polyangiales bacterium]